MTTHDLKTWPEQFQAVVSGVKRHEVRRFDRPFAVGDTLNLHEYDPAGAWYTGRVVSVLVTCVTSPGTFGLPPDVGVMGISSPEVSRAESSNRVLVVAADNARLRAMLGALVDTFNAAVAAHEARGRGGQHVPYHGDFANVPPSTVSVMRRWARAIWTLLYGDKS